MGHAGGQALAAEHARHFGHARFAGDRLHIALRSRVAEVARMLGGDRLATSVAHAQEMLGSASGSASSSAPAKPRARERRSAK